MPIWSCDQEVCAVCVYWCGKRDVEFNGLFCETYDSQGRCCCPLSATKDTDMYEGATCQHWKGFLQDQPIS